MAGKSLTPQQWQSFLKPGDILLYTSPGLLGWWIRTKTWEDVNHSELYLGDGKCAASRGPNDGTGGVNTYDLRTQGLLYVARPNLPFDIERMRRFHESCVGQKYDTWGVIKVFYRAGKGAPDKAYCSEHVARMCLPENGGPGLFNRKLDCDRVSPGMLKGSPHVDLWSVQDVEELSDLAEEVRAVGGDAGR